MSTRTSHIVQFHLFFGLLRSVRIYSRQPENIDLTGLESNLRQDYGYLDPFLYHANTLMEFRPP